MAKKTYRFHAQVAVADPSQDQRAVTDPTGTIVLMPAVTGVKYIPAGEPIEMDEVEGNRILKLVGPYRQPMEVAGQAVVLR